jgi:hypothetical protein
LYVTVCCILRWMTMLLYVVSYDGWLCYSMLYLTMDDYVIVCCILRWMTMLQYVVSYDGWLCYSMLYLTMDDYATVCCILRWMTVKDVSSHVTVLWSKMNDCKMSWYTCMIMYYVSRWTARSLRLWCNIMSRDERDEWLQDLGAYDTVLCLEMSDCKISILTILMNIIFN